MGSMIPLVVPTCYQSLGKKEIFTRLKEQVSLATG
jgi:hypothetical protein